MIMCFTFWPCGTFLSAMWYVFLKTIENFNLGNLKFINYENHGIKRKPNLWPSVICGSAGHPMQGIWPHTPYRHLVSLLKKIGLQCHFRKRSYLFIKCAFVWFMWSYSTHWERSCITLVFWSSLALLGIQLMEYGPTHYTIIWFSLMWKWVLYPILGKLTHLVIKRGIFLHIFPIIRQLMYSNIVFLEKVVLKYFAGLDRHGYLTRTFVKLFW